MPKTRSRYFDTNVRLVAGVCSRCYLEGDDDVRIVAVNRKFLGQVENRRKAVEYLRNAPQQTFDHLQPDDLKLPTSPITPNASHHFRLNDYNNSNVSSLCTKTVGNLPARANVIEIKNEINSPHHKHNWYPTKELNYLKKEPLWSPPRSPHNLIEESLFRNPWSLLVATIFLNKTSCMCARPRVEEFLKDFSGPSDVLQKHPSELERYFLDLGLFKKRAQQVWRMSYDYVHKNWRNAKELYGIGKYGEDAYRMFVLGDLEIEPTDRFLRIYRDWIRMKEKEEKKMLMDSDDD